MKDLKNLVLVKGSNVVEKNLEWLWYPFIPKNKVCILAGFPGEGKSTMAVDIMASVTTARALPECENNSIDSVKTSPVAENVLYINPEDGLSDTIKPRLMKAGADLERCMFLPEDLILGNEKMIHYLEILEYVVSKNAIKLVVIDPLNTNLPFDVSSRGGDKLNKLMAGLSGIAERNDCAFILVTHLVKNARVKEELDMGDVLGSTGVIGTVRMALLVEEQSWGTSKQKTLRHIKSNISAQDKAINFRIDGNEPFSWGVFFDCNAKKPPSDKNIAKQCIINALSVTKLRWKDLEKMRRDFCISDSTWKRAKNELGLICDFEKKTWALPKE